MYTVYGKPNCPLCVKAKKLLEKEGIDHNYIDLSTDLEKLEQFKSLGFRSVPVICLGDKTIGGYGDLQDHLLDTL